MFGFFIDNFCNNIKKGNALYKMPTGE